MKNIFLLIFSLCTTSYIFAQTKKNIKNDGMTFLKFSLNASNISSKISGNNASTSSSRLGYGFGVERLLELNDNIFLSGQVLLNSRGYKDVRTTYIDVPIAINFLLGKNKLFLLGTGVYGGYAISGKYKSQFDGWKKMQFGESLTDKRSPIDAGVVINFAYTFANGYPLLTATYQIGINNVISKANQTGSNTNRLNMAQLSFGYPLNIFKKISTSFKKK